MSLGVAVKGPEGVVLAVDSRVTLGVQQREGIPHQANFDNATKLLSFSEPHNHVGAVTYGAAVIGLRTAHSFIPELEQTRLADKDRMTIATYAKEISDFFMKQWNKSMPGPDEYSGAPMTFVVGGYDKGAAYGKIFLFNIPFKPEPKEQNPGEGNFGMTWGGQLQVSTRLIHGYDPQVPNLLRSELDLTDAQLDQFLKTIKENLEFRIPYQVLPLQDCVNLATFLIRTTINAQELSVGVRGVGGPIDVAIVTRPEGLRHIKQKEITVDAD